MVLAPVSAVLDLDIVAQRLAHIKLARAADLHRGIGKLFMLRGPRRVGADPSERLPPTAQLSPRARRLRLPGGARPVAH